MISLKDAAFALGSAGQDGGPWSLREAMAVPCWPAQPAGAISVRQVTKRFGPSGKALRTLANGTTNVWADVSRNDVVAGIRRRLRDPAIMSQKSTGLCGPFAIVFEFARRSPVRYINAARELLETGRLTCPTGRVIEAEEELRGEPAADIGAVDWLLTATMRDDANVWEDVDDDANGWETITLWGDERSWTRDVLNLPNGGWETCFSWGEVSCMRKAQHAVEAGGVAFFLVDANLIKDGGNDDEEESRFHRIGHKFGEVPDTSQPWRHSKDDDFPPDHWIGYLGGLDLGSDPDDDQEINFRVWSWGAEFEIRATVEAFSEYLYAVAYGRP